MKKGMFQIKMMETGAITFKFFEKSMSSEYVVMEGSAMAESQKLAILGQEMVRRMITTSEQESINTRVGIIDSYDKKLEKSG